MLFSCYPILNLYVGHWIEIFIFCANAVIFYSFLFYFANVRHFSEKQKNSGEKFCWMGKIGCTGGKFLV